MKNRKIAIIAFLLCACTIIGLGYAAFSTELTISGTAHAKTRDSLKVYFVGAEKPAHENGTENMCKVATLSVSENEETSLTVNMETQNMTNVGHMATAKFKIKNDESVKDAVHVKIENPVLTLTASNPDLFDPKDIYDVQYEFKVAEDNPTGEGHEGHTVTFGTDNKTVTDLPPQHSVYLIVTIELKVSITNETINYAAPLNLTFSALPTSHNTAAPTT